MMDLIKNNFPLLSFKEKNKLLVIVIISILVLSMDIVTAALIYPLIQSIVDPNTKTFISEITFFKDLFKFENNEQILTVLILILTATILKAIIFLFNIFFQYRTLESINFRISRDLYRKYLNSEWTDISKKEIPSILRNISAECSAYVFKNLSSITNLFSDFFLIFGLTCLLIFLEPLASILAIIFLIMVAGSINFIAKSYNIRFGKIRAKQSKIINKHIIQTFRALRNIKILNIQENFLDKFEQNLFPEVRARTNQGIIQSLPRIILEILGIFTIATILGILHFSGGDFQESVSFIGVFFVSIIKLLPATNRIIIYLQVLRFGKASVNIINKEFYTINESKNNITKKDQVFFDEKFKSLEFKNISFAYEKNNFVIKDLNFYFDNSQIIGISGESGKGKSTLLDLISGLIIPQKGEIIINGKKNIIQLNEWKKKIGFVFQDTYLLDDSLKNNIALGFDEDKIENEKIDYAIKYSQLDKFSNELENGIDYVFGDIEQRLSGGQKQRIGIARALYNKPEILILDEATSALDFETEKKILDILKELKFECSIIIVSHKKSTLSICDKIINL